MLEVTDLEYENLECAAVSARGSVGIVLSQSVPLSFCGVGMDTARGDNPANGNGCPSSILRPWIPVVNLAGQVHAVSVSLVGPCNHRSPQTVGFARLRRFCMSPVRA